IEDGNDNKKITFYIPAIKNFVDKDPADIVPYAPIAGLPEFRKHWQKWIIQKGKQEKNLPSGICDLTNKLTLPAVVPGITFGIYHVVKLFLTPGETIISPNKRWGNYDSVISKNCGAKISSFEVFTEKREFNVSGMTQKMEESIKNQGKVVLILNFPNNPTGYVPDKEEAEKIVNSINDFADKNKKPIVVICDDAYEGYVYDKKGITASLFYELAGKSSEYVIPLKLDGASKEMLMYGGRIGLVTLGLNEKWYDTSKKEEFLSEIENKFQAVIRSTTSNANRFIQSTLCEMFNDGIDKILKSREKIVSIVEERYTLINELLSDVDKKSQSLTVDPNSGGFFLLINIDKKVSATEFNEHLLKKYKTGLIPIVKEDLGINALRIAYSGIPKGQIPKLVENIKNALKDFNL
ncbi:MAG: aminotransferase class I/II-fold pyridoxal phosphate-dependent enzyme, partial [archaeon]|nr:aminotransferase class I/II-fold pyridoxal phosphate-dependent enzyme [archaeon]